MHRLLFLVLILVLIVSGLSSASAQDGGDTRQPITPDNAAEVARLGFEESVSNIAFNANGTWVAKAKGYSIEVSSLETGDLLHEFDVYGLPTCLLFSPDSTLLVGCVPYPTAWNLETGETKKFNITDPKGVALSPDGRMIAGGTRAKGNTQVYIWDIASGEIVQTVGETNGWLFHFGFSPDSKVIRAVVGVDYQEMFVISWDIATGGRQATMGPLNVHDAMFSPDGALLALSLEPDSLASETENGRLYLYDSDNKLVDTLVGHHAPAEMISFSADHRYLLSYAAYPDNSIEVWDTEAGESLVRFPADYKGFAVLSPDQSMVAAASYVAEDVHVWDVATGEMLVALDSPTGMANLVQFNPDGSLISTIDSESTLWQWGFPTGEEATASGGTLTNVLGTANTDVDLLMVTGRECTVAAGETVLALGQTADGAIGFYAGGPSCEGVTWMGMGGIDLFTWDLPEGETILDLVMLPEDSDDMPLPLSMWPQDAVVCANATTYSDPPAGGLPYRVYSEGWYTNDFPPEALPYSEADVEVVVCESLDQELVQDCNYGDGYHVERFRYITRLKLVNYATGGIFAKQSFYGGDPDPCPQTQAFANGNTVIIMGPGAEDEPKIAWIRSVTVGGYSPPPSRTIVIGGTINARSEPLTSSEVISQLTNGTPVNIIGRNEAGDWVLVLRPDMSKAWLYTSLLQIAAQTDVAQMPVVDGPAADIALPTPPGS